MPKSHKLAHMLYCQHLKNSDTQKIAVVILKFEQCGFNIE